MKLRKVISDIIPAQGYIALTFYPWVFIRKNRRDKFTSRVERHETTHALQQIETLWILFLVIYALEYVVKLIITSSHRTAYKSISFEQEAFEHELEISYNDVRRPYNWLQYVFKLYKW